MATAAAACAQGAPASSAVAVAAAVVLLGGWAALVAVAWGYPAAAQPVRAASSKLLILVAFVGAIVLMPLAILTPRDHCGALTGSAADVAALVFLGAVVCLILAVTLRAEGTAWVAAGFVFVTDLVLLVLFGCEGAAAHRSEILAVLGVHGACTAVGSGWARSVRHAPPAARAKGSEAARVLVGGWVVLLLLGLVVDRGQPSGAGGDAVLVNLFLISAITLTMGTGYTRYAEARAAMTPGRTQTPDRLDAWASQLNSTRRQLRQWATRYAEWT